MPSVAAPFVPTSDELRELTARRRLAPRAQTSLTHVISEFLADAAPARESIPAASSGPPSGPPPADCETA